MMEGSGYGYEWDAELFGGPGDGCFDRVIELKGNIPPKFLIKILDGEEIRRESLSEKLLEYWSKPHIDGNQKIAIYKLRGISENKEVCSYDYIETATMKEFREHYEEK